MVFYGLADGDKMVYDDIADGDSSSVLLLICHI